jgi:DNA-binding NarL/FixJ family response regulator
MESREVVLLLWIRPSILSDFERALEGSPFRVEGLRIGAETLSDREPPIPERSLYAVESEAPRSATEALVGRLLSCRAGSKILVLSEAFTESSAFPLLRIGVKGLLSYSEIPERLPWALAELSQGGYWVPRELLTRFVEAALAETAPKAPPAVADELTEREKQVMTILLRNSSNKEIASSLRISERTAKFHVSNVLAKYGVRRRADLILLAYSAQRDS